MVITPTACLHFAWSATLLRVGGLAARLACIAAAAVPARPLQPPNTLRRGPDAKRTCLTVGPTQFTLPHQTQQKSRICVMSGVAV